MTQKICIAFVLLLNCCFIYATTITADKKVRVERVPDDGIQPQLMRDDADGIHLVYFKKHDTQGKKRTGDLYYRQRNRPSGTWSPAIRVSSTSFNHLGPVSKASASMDSQGRVHVVWFIPGSGGYRYSRSNLARSSFEAERSPVTEFTEGLDAEASIATHDSTVTITWHAGSLMDEASRSVYTLSSTDYGETFGASLQASDPMLGACACCSLASQYNENGLLQIAFRSAINNDGRHMQYLSGPNNKARTVGDWTINACPVSSNRLKANWLAFEKQGRLWTVDVSNQEPAHPVRGSKVRQKHPSLAINSLGQRLLVWGEAPGYFDGGSMQMQLYAKQGGELDTPDHSSKNIGEYNVTATIADADDSFLVLY